MTITQARVKEAQARLMEAIGKAIEKQTTQINMPLEDVVAVLAYMTGSAIKHAGRSISTTDELRRMVNDNVDRGMGTQKNRPVSLILPDRLN